MIDMAFAKKRVDDRKLWLLALEPGKQDPVPAPVCRISVCLCRVKTSE